LREVEVWGNLVALRLESLQICPVILEPWALRSNPGRHGALYVTIVYLHHRLPDEFIEEREGLRSSTRIEFMVKAI
jgi:hypothetical protein